METFREEFTVDETQRFRIGLFVRAGEYRLWSLFKSNLHFFGTRDEGGYVYLWGTERLGRDVLSRIVVAARISLSVGLVGVFLSFILGSLLIDAQNVATLTTHPWMLLPALCVIVIVLCFNFVGDGLRDSADPYHNL